MLLEPLIGILLGQLESIDDVALSKLVLTLSFEGD